MTYLGSLANLYEKEDKVGRLRYFEKGKSFLDYHLFILSSPFVCMVFLVEFLEIVLKKLKEVLCV
jgi:hypothetical protein